MSGPAYIESPVTATIIIDGRRFLNFAGSSYLGLAGRAESLKAGVEALTAHGSGYQFARTYGVATPAHADVESQAAAYFGAPAAIYLANGYSMGLVVLAAILQQFGAIFYDERSHFSLRDAAAASGLPRYPFRHLDPEDLGAQLKSRARSRERPLVLTDGLYSTFGDIPPLDAFAEAVEPYGGRLLVDEAHSFGVLGDHGGGARQHFGLSAELALSGGSTGKALGVQGGLLLGSQEEVAAFRRAPAARGASAGLPAAAAMCAANLRYVADHPELLQRLRDNTRYAKARISALGLETRRNVAPVVTISPGPRSASEGLHQALRNEGIYTLLSDYIGAGAGGVIRCGIFADHTCEDIDRLADALKRHL